MYRARGADRGVATRPSRPASPDGTCPHARPTTPSGTGANPVRASDRRRGRCRRRVLRLGAHGKVALDPELLPAADESHCELRSAKPWQHEGPAFDSRHVHTCEPQSRLGWGSPASRASVRIDVLGPVNIASGRLGRILSHPAIARAWPEPERRGAAALTLGVSDGCRRRPDAHRVDGGAPAYRANRAGSLDGKLAALVGVGSGGVGAGCRP